MDEKILRPILNVILAKLLCDYTLYPQIPALDPINKAVDEILKFTDTPKPSNNWVNVNDRLPEKLQRILMCFKEKGVVSGTWFGGEDGCFQSDNALSDIYSLADNTMDFWQPLPQPPSEVQDAIN